MLSGDASTPTNTNLDHSLTSAAAVASSTAAAIADSALLDAAGTIRLLTAVCTSPAAPPQTAW